MSACTPTLVSRFASIVLTGLVYFCSPFQAEAQGVFDTRTIGMGGSGVAASSGIGSVGSNPANLMIFERPQRWSVKIGHGSLYHKEGFNRDNLSRPQVYIHPFLAQSNQSEYPTTGSLTALRESWFPSGVNESYQVYQTDVLLGGIAYTGRNIGLAATHRIKGESSFQIGRGWYEDTIAPIDNIAIRNRNLSHAYYLRHEFAFSLAWEYDLVSGWLSDLSRIYIGFTPKLIVPVSYANHTLQSVYSSPSELAPLVNVSSYSGQTAGQASGDVRQNLQTLAAIGSVGAPGKATNLYDPAGLGAGLDIGFTYIIGLDRDISLTSRNVTPTRYSLRISASLLDVGLVSFNQDPQRFFVAERSNTIAEADAYTGASGEYSGNPTEFFHFLADSFESDLISNIREGSADPIRLLLPTRAHAGVALQLNRLVVTGELQHPLNSWTLRTEKTSLHAGTELRILKIIPLRAGFVLQADEPFIYTAGMGLDFRNISFSAATAMRTRSGLERFIPVLSSVGALHIRF